MGKVRRGEKVGGERGKECGRAEGCGKYEVTFNGISEHLFCNIDVHLQYILKQSQKVSQDEFYNSVTIT